MMRMAHMSVCTCGHRWSMHFQRYDGQHGCARVDDDYDGSWICRCEGFTFAATESPYAVAAHGKQKVVHLIDRREDWSVGVCCGLYSYRATVDRGDVPMCRVCERVMGLR